MKINIDNKWLVSIRGLDDRVRLSLYDAIFDYVSGKNIMIEADAKVAFDMIRPMLDTHKPKSVNKQLDLFDYPDCCSNKLKALYDWMGKYTPYIFHNFKNQLNEKEFRKLLDKYGIKAICETLEQIENRKDHRKKYDSVYRTLLNWLKNGYS